MVPPESPAPDGHRVRCHLDRLLEERGLTLRALSDTVGISTVNLSVMKNDRAKAVRFSTLTLLCDALACTPGDLFTVEPRVHP
ncbi:helix-turn-helix domain-containing protein [Corynebacterium xerosis]|uniref:helix-turn-helix domain-containing protein n=1 Tax=Corynebacterium xerosis TaxID=1725 RepID=UPI00366A8B09